jgi:hypothetical protein
MPRVKHGDHRDHGDEDPGKQHRHLLHRSPGESIFYPNRPLGGLPREDAYGDEDEIAHEPVRRHLNTKPQRNRSVPLPHAARQHGHPHNDEIEHVMQTPNADSERRAALGLAIG